MQIVGVEVGGGSPVFAYTLGHGEDPHQRAWEDGYKIIRPLSATGTIEDEDVESAPDDAHRHGVDQFNRHVAHAHARSGKSRQKMTLRIAQHALEGTGRQPIEIVFAIAPLPHRRPAEVIVGTIKAVVVPNQLHRLPVARVLAGLTDHRHQWERRARR